MARKKTGFDFSELEKFADQLDELGGSAALKRAVNSGMIAAKQEINKQVTASMAASNLPAGGKYSTGDTLASLDKNMNPEWQGNIGSLPLGFDMKQSGLTSIFLMEGTPHHGPVPGLKENLKGTKAKATARKEQGKAIKKVVERLGG